MLFIVLLASSAPHQVEALPSGVGAAPPEPVVLLLGRQLIERRLAAFLEIQPGRYLASSVIQHACLRPAVRGDSLLLFLPNSQRCEQIMQADRLMLPQRLHAITGSLPPPDLQAGLQDRPFLILTAATPVQPQGTQGCICPTNSPPEGMVGCEVQSRTAGAGIAAIDYFATDADGDSLSAVFTHQRGIDPIQPGLPPPLASSCTSDPGTLQCTVTGNAPGQAGDLQLMLEVSDGAAILNLVSLLEVMPVNDELIFIDQFEVLACP